MTSARPLRPPLLVALALACAVPASLAAQNRDSIPQGQQQPPTLARPPVQQPPAQKPPAEQPVVDQPAQEPATQGTSTPTTGGRREPVRPPAIDIPTIPGTGQQPTGFPGIPLPRLPGSRREPAQPTTVQVPSLAGRTVEEAREILAAARLTLGQVSELAVQRPAGTVFLQSPAAGRTVQPGQAVAVSIARAPAAAPVRTAVVPPITDLPLDQAAARLQAAGLRLGGVAGASGSAARVVAHTYRVGQTVPLGTEIDVRTTVPAAPVAARPATPDPARPAAVDSLAVPDVRTLRLADARTALEGAGFAAAFDPALADSAAWTVATQAPGAGARVPAGSAVQLALAAPAAVVAAVPPPVVPTTLQPAAPPPVADGARGRAKLWIFLVVALIAAVVATAWRMRAAKAAGKAAPPIAGVRVALRTDAEGRASVEGSPFKGPRIRLRLRPASPASRIDTAGPLFRAKGGAG
ncbi:MAG TPA: PASTA domain-containing protein [Longimicrobium sp.]|jgi:serine/threonine-protein kinase|nr:PASTA domain-containing protein [Longimicrobium sp.]